MPAVVLIALNWYLVYNSRLSRHNAANDIFMKSLRKKFKRLRVSATTVLIIFFVFKAPLSFAGKLSLVIINVTCKLFVYMFASINYDSKMHKIFNFFKLFLFFKAGFFLERLDESTIHAFFLFSMVPTILNLVKNIILNQRFKEELSKRLKSNSISKKNVTEFGGSPQKSKKSAV